MSIGRLRVVTYVLMLFTGGIAAFFCFVTGLRDRIGIKIDPASDFFILVSILACIIVALLVLLLFIADKTHGRNTYVTDFSIEECEEINAKLDRKLDRWCHFIYHKEENDEVFFKCDTSADLINYQLYPPKTLGVKFKKYGEKTLMICRVKYEAAYVCRMVLFSLFFLIAIYLLLGMLPELSASTKMAALDYYSLVFASVVIFFVALMCYGGVFDKEGTWNQYKRHFGEIFYAEELDGPIDENVFKLPRKF